jgi:TMEM175 potassium channel family protein
MSPTRKRQHSRYLDATRTPMRTRGRVAARLPAEAEDRTGLDRLIFFSDAVFAIAITLLVIDIHLPDLGSSATASQITQSLRDLMPNFFGFVVSFVVIGGIWSTHHRTFRVIRRYDTPFVWMNILFLMSIAFLPFSNSVLSEYGNLTPSVIFYSVSLALTSALFVLLWLYATFHHRLVDANLSPLVIRENLLRLCIPLMVFILSVPAAAITPRIEVFWLTIPALSRLVRRRSHDQGSA